MSTSSILVVNDYGGGTLERRTRVNAAGVGRSRYSITIKSEPLLIQTDPKLLGAGPAMAIAEHLKERIRGISETASPATMKARLSAQKAVIAGEPWAMKRYSGGKTGTRAPARSDKLFHDSGRFIESIKVGATSKGWVVNIAANRLSPETLNGGEAALQRIWDRLRELAPVWGDVGLLKDDIRFKRTLDQTLLDAVQKAGERTVELKRQLMSQSWGKIISIGRAAVRYAA